MNEKRSDIFSKNKSQCKQYLWTSQAQISFKFDFSTYELPATLKIHEGIGRQLTGLSNNTSGSHDLFLVRSAVGSHAWGQMCLSSRKSIPSHQLRRDTSQPNNPVRPQISAPPAMSFSNRNRAATLVPLHCGKHAREIRLDVLEILFDREIESLGHVPRDADALGKDVLVLDHVVVRVGLIS